MAAGKEILVIGGSHAGAALVTALRADGHDGPIRLVSAESDLPYQRPPLSKAFLKDPDHAVLELKPAAFYAQAHVDLHLGVEAVEIDRAAQRVRLADGRSLSYDGLALCLGARVRKPEVPGAGLDGVVYLRSAADARDLRRRLGAARDVVVVGGGFIGLEAAATAALLGKTVTVIEGGPRLMGRAVSATVSAFMTERHRQAGIDVRLSTMLGGFVGGSGAAAGRLAAVEAGGATIPADLAIVGIGVLPNVELAAAAGLETGNGILVDETLTTSDPAIVAAGDGVLFPEPGTGRRIRIESVQNANDQGRAAALTLIGKGAPYRAVPWFWSDQGPVKLQMVGLAQGATAEVVRGSLSEGRFSVFHFAGDRLIAIDSLDRPADHMIGRRLLAAPPRLTPADAADESLDLKSLIARG